ncbi:glycosyltransferase family 2 protein [Limimaricola sp. ASW11-118]|uniref:Glycosyltransferase family 2 protein n=1 Tax=Limimaricola litoreus TaxID=2955316 RepID=A0A9X2FT12_9RHOB|nr:glycosyltransferase family 2 protein [Limimaricola litoreus]
MARWSVHATVDEPIEVLAAFAAHYLDLGAEEVHLCLDRPDPAIEAVLSGLPGLRLTTCDDDYWRKLSGRRPADQERRQILNARHAFARCRSDWFFYCDADELAVASRPFSEILAALPFETTHCRIRMTERVFKAEAEPRDIYDGVFRKGVPGDPELIARAYGAAALFLSHGLSGHALGKSFLRCGAPLEPWMHFPRPRRLGALRARLTPRVVQGPLLDEGWLVHFDGFTPLHWQLKLLRYARARDHAFAQEPLALRCAARALGRWNGASRPAYRRQTRGREAQLVAVTDPAQRAGMLGAIRLQPDRRAALAAGNALLGTGLNPAAAARRALPDAGLDFSVAGFDARLRDRHADLATALAQAA